jgi:hypothetical protein
LSAMAGSFFLIAAWRRCSFGVAVCLPALASCR